MAGSLVLAQGMAMVFHRSPGSSGHAALRRGRQSIPGQTYLITTATHARRRNLTHWAVGVAVSREIGCDRLWRDNHIHAWVLMPDHVHILATLGTRESLAHLIARAKAVTGRAGCAAAASKPPFWASAFHDHALRCDEQVINAARYIIANPVRANLVDSIWRWPFWNCEWLPEMDGAISMSRERAVAASAAPTENP